MDTRLPLKDVLNRIVEDLNIVLKQLVEVMCVPRDQRLTGHEADVSRLVELFKIKEQELNDGMKAAAEQAERQNLIEHLKEEVKKRDECIARISACFKDSEDMLINAIFQANQKLKSVAEANRKKVSVEELIKYSHRISATNAVAAPVTWQQGDTQRPYPTEVEMWTGWPERMKERNKMEKDFPLASMASMGAGSSTMGSGSIPPQHEMFMRPPQSAGIFPPPGQVQSSPMTGSRQGGWLSPRGMHAQNSPRAARPPTPGNAGQGQPQGSFPRPSSVNVGGHFQQQPPQHPIQHSVKSEASSVPNSVEVVSSDSSSSSDSDSQ